MKIKKLLVITILLYCGIMSALPVPVVQYGFNNTLLPTIGTDQLTSQFSVGGPFYNYVAGPNGFGNALNITATGGQLQYFDMAQLYDFPQRTICFWFKPGNNASATAGYIYMSDGPLINNAETGITIKNNSVISFLIGSNTSSSAFIPNQWNFAAIVRSASDIKYYLNCKLIATFTNMANITANNSVETYPAFSRIGNVQENDAQYWPQTAYQYVGALDEFAIYNSALSASDLVTLMGANEQLFPVLTVPSVICSGAPITANGSASYGTPFNTITNTFWSIQPSDQDGNIITGSTEWSKWYSGAPSAAYSFPTVSNGGPTITCGGYYRVKLAIQNDCVGWAETVQVIHIVCPPSFNPVSSAKVCPGQPVTIGYAYSNYNVIHLPYGNLTIPNLPEDFYTFQWSPSTWLSSSNISNPTVTLPNGFSSACPGNMPYVVTTTDGYGCSSTRQVNVNYATQATPVTISESGPGLSATACNRHITLTANTNCLNIPNYSWQGHGVTSTSSTVLDSPTVATTYVLTSSNACFTSNTNHIVYPCIHPTGAFPLLNVDQNVVINWSGNYGAGGFHIYDNTMPVGNGPAYNAYKLELYVFDRWGNQLYYNPWISPCGGFWNGLVVWNCVYNGHPLPVDTYTFKIVMTNCSGQKTVAGWFDVVGTARVANSDGGDDLVPIVKNTHIYQSGSTDASMDASNDVIIYPNPGNGVFTIEPTGDESVQTLKISDSMGKLVFSQAIIGKTTIDASFLKAGVYNLTLSGNDRIANKKLVITGQ